MPTTWRRTVCLLLLCLATLLAGCVSDEDRDGSRDDARNGRHGGWSDPDFGPRAVGRRR